MMLGALADDFTGACDIAVAFRGAGLRVALIFDIDSDAPLPESDVAIVALKTRTLPPTEAVEKSLAALEWLRARGAERFFFKYCSTFDSTATGNIGPVADALSTALGATRPVFVPASPAHGRTQHLGHLFVGDKLLSESHMRHHPLTPMTESNVVALLQRQTPHSVGLVPTAVVRDGHRAVRASIDRLDADYAVVDAITDADLFGIGRAVVGDILTTGAAGLARGLGRALVEQRGSSFEADESAETLTARAIVLSGSCSARTLEQLDRLHSDGHPLFQLDALATPDSRELTDAALTWLRQQPESPAPVVYASLPPEELHHVQEELGVERSAAILEAALSAVARGAVEMGVDRIVVAGGESSGAVVTALGVANGNVGREEAEGVPWIHSTTPRVDLLLKSGNFGDADLLTRASRSSI